MIPLFNKMEYNKHVVFRVKVGVVAYAIIAAFYCFSPRGFKRWEVSALTALLTLVAVMDPILGATLNRCVNDFVATIIGALVGYFANFITDPADSRSIWSMACFTLSFFLMVFLAITGSKKGVKKSDSVTSAVTSALTSACLFYFSGLIIGISLFLFIYIIPPILAQHALHNYIIQYMDSLASFYQVSKELLEKLGQFENISEVQKAFIESQKRVTRSYQKLNSMLEFGIWESFRFPNEQYKKLGDICAKSASDSNSLSCSILTFLKKKSHVSSWNRYAAAQKKCLEMCAECEYALKSLSLSLKSKTVPSRSLIKHLLSVLYMKSLFPINGLSKVAISHIFSTMEESFKTMEDLVRSVDELAQVAGYHKTCNR